MTKENRWLALVSFMDRIPSSIKATTVRYVFVSSKSENKGCLCMPQSPSIHVWRV